MPNLLECEVIEVLSKPVRKYQKWWVKVRYICYGNKAVTQLLFDNKNDAELVEVGHRFMR
jgi:hypothetical protein